MRKPGCPTYTAAEVQRIIGEAIIAEREACVDALRRPKLRQWHLTPYECAEILLNRSRP